MEKVLLSLAGNKKTLITKKNIEMKFDMYLQVF